MLIDLTVRGPRGDHDVRLDAPAGAAFGAVRAQLAGTAGVPINSPLFLDDVLLADDALLAGTGLRNGSVVGVTPAPPARAGHPYALRVSGGPAAGRVHALRRGRTSIGRGAECDITLDDERISRRHATVEVAAGRVVVLDHGSTNGSTVDGAPVPRTGTPLVPGAVLQLGDSLLSVAAPSVRAASVSLQDGRLLVHRSSRPSTPHPPEVVALPAAPLPERPPRVQWLAAAVPALAAGGLAWFTGSTLFLLFGLLSPVMLLSTALGDRWQGRRARRRAQAGFRAARRAAVAALAAALSAETEQRRTTFPDPTVLALVAETPGAGIWARRPGDDDWLTVRVGCGTVPSRTLVRDDGAERPGGPLRSVPVVVELRTRPVGLAGPPATRAGLARWWVAQLAVAHSPDDLSLVVLTTDDAWAWCRWLPHVRLVTTTPQRAELRIRLAADVEHRLRRRAAGSGWTGETTVLVVDGEIEPALAEVVARGAAVGVTAVWLRTDPGSLPSGCTVVVAGADGRVRVVDGGTRSATAADDLVADTVTTGWVECVARSLSPLVDAQGRRADRVPDACTLTGLLGVRTADAAEVARAWSRSTGRPDTVLGVTADGVLGVDLEADGPHALVAGTTGSGKSELLRTLVTGLCLLHPPEELGVLLIDYKGGAAFAECADLPHCAGLVTDLDARLTARALRSLDAEIRRREVVLRDAGAADLQAYRAGAPPVPLSRLVIVVDEFATLADELPDFVSGLIGIAQRGRSLGVHLVLATQRPGSVVSPEIRANTSLRIALRVTEPGESVDVVGTDDASAITPSTPGRAVLRDGTGLRVFQTARPTVTPPRTTTPRVLPLDAGRRAAEPADPAGTDLGHLVQAMAGAARATGRARAASPWLPPLPGLVPAASVPRAAFALADVPEQQRQPGLLLALDPATSTLVLGTARSGRTTALASMALAAARTHRPAGVEIHLLDARGDLIELVGGLPHVATCLGPDDLDLADTLLERLAGRPPARRHLLLVDGWDVVLSVLGDDTAVVLGQRLAALVRSPGPVSVVVSGDRSLIAPRFSGAFDARLALRLGDPTDYGALGVSHRDLPVTFPPGRGLRTDDGVEFQIAVPQPLPGRTVAEAVRATAAGFDVPTGSAPRAGTVRLRPLPGAVAVGDLGPPPAGRLRLGVGGDTAAPVTLDPFAGSRRWLVSGPPRSGRSGVLAVALLEALRLGCPVLVAAPARSPVAGLATRLDVAVLDPADRPEHAGLRRRDGPDPTLLLVDDTDAFVDTEVGEVLLGWVRDTRARMSVLATGRPDELALAYRGVAAEVRRSRSGIALRPGPVDGELFGVRLPRARPGDPPGRGRLIGDPAWRVGAAEAAVAGVPVQIATPGPVGIGAVGNGAAGIGAAGDGAAGIGAAGDGADR